MVSFPKVAVVLINRNGYELTKACVDSLLKTRYPNLLIVITDNGSNQPDLDRLAELARQESSVIFHPLGYNAGFTKGNNAGIEVGMARNADYIWILNNDTEVREDSLELSVKAFEQYKLDKKRAVVSSIITYADNDNVWCNGLYDMALFNFPRSHDKGKPSADITQPGIVLKQVEYGVGCSMFVAKEFITSHGMMDEKFFIYYDDLDYSYGCYNVFIQQPLVKHKVSSTSGTKGSSRFSPFQAFLFAKNGIQFYFRKKKISWFEKLVYLSFTNWVFVILYVRDRKTLVAHLQGLREGLNGGERNFPY